MFLKSLIISGHKGIIRDIKFRKGINLIVDETPSSNDTATGNNVGKTTVLMLIDFCLGGNGKNIYLDPETKKQENTTVKNFLLEENVIIKLVLTEDIDDEKAHKITIERNFYTKPKKDVIRRINGEQYSSEEAFEQKLGQLIFPEHQSEMPSFRQIISHNFRYKEQNITNTLRTLDGFSRDSDYEALHLFLFGCNFKEGHTKQQLLEQLRQEETFKRRLENTKTQNEYEVELAEVEREIKKLNAQKSNFNLNENFQADLDKLNNVKFQKSQVASEVSRLKLRKDLIIEAENDLRKGAFNADTKQLALIYQQAAAQIGTLQKTFEQLVSYHNQMVDEKVRFITKELPEIERLLNQRESQISDLTSQEITLSKSITSSDSFEDLENIILQLNDRFKTKGEYESKVAQLKETAENIKSYKDSLEKIEEDLFSDPFQTIVKQQVQKFNEYFSDVSAKLYDEKFLLKYEVKETKGQRVYKFDTYEPNNTSSGKKQGEIASFDIAYSQFADKEQIPNLHFLLNDKKELMHDNQLVKIAKLVESLNLQFIAAILKDKLPPELNKVEYIVLTLSQTKKLFRIEG